MRDASRLLILRQGHIEHGVFTDLPQYVRRGDVLVLNETQVIAARLFAVRVPSGGSVEVLLLRPALAARYDPNATRWNVLAKPARRLRIGERLSFGELGTARVVNVHADGVREVEFALRVPFEEFLRQAGRLALPPYIKNDSRDAQARYQTVFAREPGSVAAPTASLHFTRRMLAELERSGVHIVKLVLDVGIGTFRPMQCERVDQHVMHAETFHIPTSTAHAVRLARAEGRRVVAAGTTVLRALEGSAEKHGAVCAGSDQTTLFVRPGFRFRAVDALITNFHLPRSSLLVLVSAFAGRMPVLEAYAEAIRERYRFFSFGDAMYIEP